ncbi:MAG: XdhC family protein [Acidobacteriota bacterium]
MADESEAQTITRAIKRVLDEGSRGVLATLLEMPASASSSLMVGSKLLRLETGEVIGGLGDPELEEAVARQAQDFLETRDGTKSFRVEEFAPDLTSFRSALLLFERIEAEPHLVIAGAGHVGAALARLASMLAYRVTLIDDRSQFVTRDLFSAKSEKDIELVQAENWEDAIRVAVAKGRGVSVAIVTRGHKEDEECLRAALAVKPDYVGMIGSKRRTNIVLEKLRESGADEERLQRVHAPIGLDLGAVSPEEVALAILAEIVAARLGGSGAPLSHSRRR